MRIPGHKLRVVTFLDRSGPSSGYRRRKLLHSTRTYTTPSTVPLYDNPTSRAIPLRTLYHGWLQAEDYIDLSDHRGIILDPRSAQQSEEQFPKESQKAAYITYGRRIRWTDDDRRVISYQPFPVGARGFLYYFAHKKIPMASALRFRVMQSSDPRTFPHGQDLLTEFGTPWQIPLLALANSPRLKHVQDILLRDRFLPSNLLQRCETLARSVDDFKIGPWSQLVFETLQPFYLDLGNPFFAFGLVGMEAIYPLHVKHLFSRDNYPFKSGRLLCRLEPTRGAHNHKHVVMRVLRVIEPVRMADGYDGPVSMPVVNSLITFGGRPMPFLHKRRGLGEAKYALWTRHKAEWEWTWSWRKLKETAPGHFRYPWYVGAREDWEARVVAGLT